MTADTPERTLLVRKPKRGPMSSPSKKVVNLVRLQCQRPHRSRTLAPHRRSSLWALRRQAANGKTARTCAVGQIDILDGDEKVSVIWVTGHKQSLNACGAP